MPKKLYFIRHAETIENVRIEGLRNIGRSFQKFKRPQSSDVKLGAQGLVGFAAGHTDAELSSKGKEQIQQLAEILEKENFFENITIMAHSPLVRAVQTCQGIVQNHTNVNIVELECLKEMTPAELTLMMNVPLKKRFQQFISWIEQQNDDETIAVVGHSQYFMRLLGLNYKFKNCDVWQVEYLGDGKFGSIEKMYSI